VVSTDTTDISEIRGGNQTGWVGFGSDQFEFLKEIISDRIGTRSDRVGSDQFIYYIFLEIFDRFWLDCRSFDLESGRVRVRSDQFNFFLKIKFDRVWIWTNRTGFSDYVSSATSNWNLQISYMIFNYMMHFYYYYYFLFIWTHWKLFENFTIDITNISD
jgi:hypothetical protein